MPSNKNIKDRPTGLDRRYAPALYVGRYIFGVIMRKIAFLIAFGYATASGAGGYDTAMDILLITKTNVSIDNMVRKNARETSNGFSYFAKKRTGFELPFESKKEIEECVLKNNGWDAIGTKFAKSYTKHLTNDELTVLLKFHNHKGLESDEATIVESALAKLPELKKEIQNVITESGEECRELGVELTNKFISSKQ